MRHKASGIPLAFVCLFAVWLCGCRQSDPDENPAVDQRRATGEGLYLDEATRDSVGIVAAPVRIQSVPARIQTVGWLAAKPGSEITAKAMATGFVIPEQGGKFVALGDSVNEGQKLGRLRVFISPQEESQLVAMKEEADILIRQSQVSLETARARLERLRQLSEKGTVPGKEMQSANEAMERAKAAYEEAQQQLPFLPSEPYEHPLQMREIDLLSSRAGRLMQLYVQPRQFVIQGDPLWRVSDWSTLWLRVPVFEGDLSRIDQQQSAEVNTSGVESMLSANPVGVPQPTENGRRTVDLFYEVTNTEGKLRPGQAAFVGLPTGQPTERIVVPDSAILWDGMGNPWVYLEDEQHRFYRQKIRTGHSWGNAVVVEDGLSEGQIVVTTGAEALYGEEFRGGIQVTEDDD